MGSPSSNWQADLGASLRFEKVKEMSRIDQIALNSQKSIQAAGQPSSKDAQKAAFAAETEAYQNSESRDAYDAVCNSLIDIEAVREPKMGSAAASTPGIAIGKFQDCHHIASGLISEVYRSHTLALKVITETRDIEPHNPAREVRILKQLVHPSIIQFIETSKDEHGRLILVFPYMPFTLADIIKANQITLINTISNFKDLLSALVYLHSQDIIHRDIKPSNILLASPTGSAHLADFGTTWHPLLSLPKEPPQHKELEVGTTSYRAPETLFGNRGYTTSLDMWSTGTMLAECMRTPHTPLFESRGGEEDGNQLGLILSMFKTLGTPTRETWPEAAHFTTTPFDWYQNFPGKPWEELLPRGNILLRGLVSKMVRYESTARITAKEALTLMNEISSELHQ